MGMFAQTSIVDYLLPFADQGKQTSVSICSKPTEVFCFRFPFAANKRKFPFSVSSFSVYIYLCCGFKRKTEAQVVFLNPFTVSSLFKWKFVVCPLIDEETNGSYPFANGLNGLNRLAHL
jgi:hypothetical protein